MRSGRDVGLLRLPPTLRLATANYGMMHAITPF